jgi:hypothetical protein
VIASQTRKTESPVTVNSRSPSWLNHAGHRLAMFERLADRTAVIRTKQTHFLVLTGGNEAQPVRTELRRKEAQVC